MYIELGNKGPAVKRIQELLNMAPFPRDANTNTLIEDGNFGPLTRYQVKLFQGFMDLTNDGIVGPDTQSALYNLYGVGVNDHYWHIQYDGVEVVDGRDINKPPSNFHGTIRNNINSVMLHQTGCGMPSSPKFWQKVNAHCGVLQDGTIVLMHEFDKLIWHGNALSPQSIGIEIEGNMRGVEGLDHTYWKPGGGPHSLTEAQIEALNGALFYIIKDYMNDEGYKWEYVWAHRQSSKSRQADPGSKVWKEVGLVWQERLGVGPSWESHNGYEIPQSWDPDSPCDYYG